MKIRQKGTGSTSNKREKMGKYLNVKQDKNESEEN